MADEVPGSSRASGPSGFQAHDWYSYDAYLNVHFSHMARLQRQGLVLRDGLSIIPTFDGRRLIKVNLTGSVLCCDNVLIHVDKWLEARRSQTRRRHPEVKGTSYSYHARLLDERSLIRYCTAHGLDDLHIHKFDLATGQELEQPRIPIQDLPTLSNFIIQAVELGRRAQGL